MTAAADSQAARINWKAPGTYTLVEVNSPTFTADRGYTGNGTSSYLTTGYAPGDGGGPYQFTLNSCHLGIWGLTTGTASGSVGETGFINTALTSGVRIKALDASNTLTGSMNAGAFTGGTVATAAGHTVLTRSSSSMVNTYKNGAAVLASISNTSVSLQNFAAFILAHNVNGTPANFCPRQIAMVTYGANLTPQNMADLYQIDLAYLQGVGAA